MNFRKKLLFALLIVLPAAGIIFAVLSASGENRFALLPWAENLYPGKLAILKIQGSTPLFRQLELQKVSISENGPRFLPPWKPGKSWRGNKLRYQSEILLLPSHPGKFQGKATLKITSVYGKAVTLELPFSGEVKQLAPSGTPLLPAGEILPVSASGKRLYWLIGGAALAILLAAAALIWFLRRRKAGEAEVVITLTERFLAELDVIEKQLTEQSPESALIALSDLIKRFSQERFGLPATSATGGEFLELWRRRRDSVTAETADFLRQFTAVSNTVKFARGSVDNQTMTFAVEVTRKWIASSEIKEVKP